jgi:hypothetical protein
VTPAPDDGSAARWALIRDVAALQVKLVIDGLRDALLIPLSLAAGLVDLLTRRGPDGGLFYRVLLFGRRSEGWIDLFEAADRVAPRRRRGREPGVDEVFRRLEALLVEQRSKGGVTASAVEKIDRVLDALPAPRRRE